MTLITSVGAVTIDGAELRFTGEADVAHILRQAGFGVTTSKDGPGRILGLYSLIGEWGDLALSATWADMH